MFGSAAHCRLPFPPVYALSSHESWDLTGYATHSDSATFQKSTGSYEYESFQLDDTRGGIARVVHCGALVTGLGAAEVPARARRIA